MKTSSKASGSYCAIGVSGSKIGFELGPKGMANEEIIPFPADAAAAHASVARPTWVSMIARCVTPGTAWRQQAAAYFARAFLRHPALSTRAKRVGAVVRVMHTGLVLWRVHAERELHLEWV